MMTELPNTSLGIGLKAPHFAQVLMPGHGLGFVEIHAENYMVEGGPRLAALEAVKQRMPLSIHGVGLSIGGVEPLDTHHLGRLRRLVERFEPALVSEHLAWSRHDGCFFNDLLPIAYDHEALTRVCAHLDQVQNSLGRQILLENPSTYVAFERSSWDEADFIAEVVRRSGCAILLDVCNAFISAANHHRDIHRWLAAIPIQAVKEIHLAGYAQSVDEADQTLLIDSHSHPIQEAVWQLYARVVQQTGAIPTLLERDQDLPAFEVLVREIQQASLLWPDRVEERWAA